MPLLQLSYRFYSCTNILNVPTMHPITFHIISSIWKAPSTSSCCSSSIVTDPAKPINSAVSSRDTDDMRPLSKAPSVMPIGSNIATFKYTCFIEYVLKFLNGIICHSAGASPISQRENTAPYNNRASHKAKTTLLRSSHFSGEAPDTDLPISPHAKGTSKMPAITSQSGNVCIMFITKE